eukprot:scaffold4763_cov55-Phaeocystis_antarctica.AAC.3
MPFNSHTPTPVTVVQREALASRGLSRERTGCLFTPERYYYPLHCSSCLERVRATPGEGDAREGRGRGGTDCAGNLHTPDCDARDGGGPHALARVWRGSTGAGGSPKFPPKILVTPQSC